MGLLQTQPAAAQSGEWDTLAPTVQVVKNILLEGKNPGNWTLMGGVWGLTLQRLEFGLWRLVTGRLQAFGEPTSNNPPSNLRRYQFKRNTSCTTRAVLVPWRPVT